MCVVLYADFYLNSPFAPWTFLRSLWEKKDEMNVLMLKFEDLVNNKEALVHQLVTHLGWPMPDGEFSLAAVTFVIASVCKQLISPFCP